MKISLIQTRVSTDGFTTPNVSLIETHVNCLNSAGGFYCFLLYEPCSVAYQNKALNFLVQKQHPCGHGDQPDFELRPPSVKKISTQL